MQQSGRVGIVIYWELCKRHGFENDGNFYDHKTEAVHDNKNKTNTTLKGFVTQTDSSIKTKKDRTLLS